MKRIFCAVLIFVVLLSLCGCAEITDYIDGKLYDAARVGFSNVELTEDSKETVFKASEFASRNSEYASYGSSFHYNQLNEKEKIIYHIFEYALENGYTNVLIDGAVVSDSDTLDKVITYLSLDSPLAEQNFRYESGTFTKNYPTKIFGFLESKGTYEGLYITIDSFTTQAFKKKQLAISKAESVIKEIPSGISDVQKAEWIYRYVADNVEYQEYCANTGADGCGHLHNYLYDAALVGKTHCDGYANYLSLLMNLSGIECIEKMYTGETDSVGHTWNMICIDGEWYNCDATGEKMIPSVDSSMGAGYYFAFPDERQKYTPNYADIYPEAVDSIYMPIDAYLTSAELPTFYTVTLEAFAVHDGWALILLDEYSEATILPYMQRLANKCNCTISHFCINLHDGRVAVLVCYEKYYN